MPEPQHEPLISSQTSINMGTRESDSTKRALKVAGLTMLACALIAGQALTAYFLLSQKSQISSLQDSEASMKQALNRPQSGASSGRMASMVKPMNSLAMITDEDPKPESPSVQKSCVEQAVEAGNSDSRPQCDEQGNFLPMQCQQKPKFCWCVKANGEMIVGTARAGPVNCGGTPKAMVHMPAMSSQLEVNDE
ncbi:hypothetical protein COCON_G00080700 [Conger conger]|uniref:Thyroglobulin type-1 domain-containing protein n=1 Tax=Conger conger TaxID=82655 RepID=A0A9Q1DPK7_CONCO|nr:thyroglobulin-like [Conger conger]KAJ8276318.1 hypothetical protein COCON_G00080700 [Conger conger]